MPGPQSTAPQLPDLAWEQRCLERVKSGDRQAFAELYRAFAPRLYAQVLLPKLGNAGAAEDALSETFRSLLEHAHELAAGERSLLHWLARVAANKATDMHRKHSRSRRALANFESLLGPLREESDDPFAERELDATRARARRTVGEVLGALQPRYRRALELRFLEETSRERCAELMEVKLGTFDVLLLRALRAFRKQWELCVAARASQPSEEPSR